MTVVNDPNQRLRNVYGLAELGCGEGRQTPEFGAGIQRYDSEDYFTDMKKNKGKTDQSKIRSTKTTPLLSDILPLPDPKFRGRIGKTYADSEADIISLRTPPDDAPNVLLVMLDDVGFGQASTFGGPANTPTLQRLADEGLRYNRFHTTALCSPTRAALLSGRNHHSVHSGVITEMATGFPGYDGSWPREAASIAEILQGNQYATAAFGKWHNTPDHELSAAGPFHRWPTGKGFGYSTGFREERPANGTLRCSRIPHPSSHPTTIRNGISLKPSPTGRSLGSVNSRLPRRTCRSLSTSRRVPAIPRTTCTRSGLISTRANSITVGTVSVRSLWKIKRSLALFPGKRS